MQKIIAYIGWAAFAAYLVLGAPGCTSPASTWRVDSPELADAARAASDAWCEASAGEWCPVIDDSSGAPIIVDSEDPTACGKFSTPSGVIRINTAEVARGGCWVLDADGFAVDTATTLTALLAHEMAHERLVARGDYGHSADPLSVIHGPVNYWAGEISASDVDFVLGR